MDIKLRKLNEKTGKGKIGRIMLSAVVFVGFLAAALGLGIVCKVNQMDGTLRDLFVNQYADSKLHRRDVEKTINKLWAQIENREEPELSYDRTQNTFTGIEDVVYDFVLDISSENNPVRRRSNIPDRKGEVWDVDVSYITDHFTCYYLWDGEAFTFGEAVGEEVRKRIEMPPCSETVRLGIGFDQSLMQSGQERLEQLNNVLLTGVSLLAGGFLAAFLGVTFLMLGKKRRHVVFLYTDLALLLSLASGLMALFFIAELLEGFADLSREDYTIITDFFDAAGFSICMTLVLLSICEVVKNIRGHMGSQQLYILKYLRRIRKKIIGEAYYDQGIQSCINNRERATVCLIALIIAANIMGSFYLPGSLWKLVCLALLAVVLWYYRKGSRKIAAEYEKLLRQLDQLMNENYQDHDMLDETSVFARESCQLSMLGYQIQESVERQIQAEKMKIDLVTNVSHDLKTPLTSIISYIDLLKKEELEPVSRDYVTVLEKKSERLKKMISDVFELTKATSGNLEIKKSELDFGRLLIQILADMEWVIEKSPVKVVSDIPEQLPSIYSDGEKLYRVIQNVMDNALKYAMPGTRVYITLREEGKEAVISVKNVAAYEMNFTREEVLGRFFRGDCARTTEGSGLGLAIAKEFAESCGGRLDLSISGDVFRVELRFPVLNRGD